MNQVKGPLMLMILDGWGEKAPCPSNAISCAQTPIFDRLRSEYPRTLLKTSGEDVGLPEGQMGNSEVGHLNMGSGRIVYQDLTRIDQAVKTGELAQNSILQATLDQCAQKQCALHFLGLLSDGGVHSHIRHLYALLELAKQKQIKQVYVHAFLDGRDVPPQSAREYVQALEAKMQELGVGQIATIGGRYWGMDRDKRWERVEKHYQAFVAGQGVQAQSADAALAASYAQNITDEFVEPTVLLDNQGNPRGSIQTGDSVVFFNFRADRAREITRAFVDRNFSGFTREIWPQIHFICLTQYDITIPAPVVFPPQELTQTLGEVLAQAGVKQLRIAETEKYAHITFFFNGGVEAPNPGEDRVLIPSPKVATYDLQPEMSAYQVTERVIQEIQKNKYAVIILNYANADMVGHTGVMEAAVKAITVLDQCLGQVVDAVLKQNGAVMITADHGNAEEMLEEDSDCPCTAHTNGPTPFILVDPQYKGGTLHPGSLQDVAPTMLQWLGIAQPPEMTGKSLIDQ